MIIIYKTVAVKRHEEANIVAKNSVLSILRDLFQDIRNVCPVAANETLFNCAIIYLQRNCGSIKATARFNCLLLKQMLIVISRHCYTYILFNYAIRLQDTRCVTLGQCRVIRLCQLFVFEHTREIRISNIHS